jgi:hypothetical protein
MTATHPEVSDEQVADLERRFGRSGVVELTYQIAREHARPDVLSARHHRAGFQFRRRLPCAVGNAWREANSQAS